MQDLERRDDGPAPRLQYGARQDGNGVYGTKKGIHLNQLTVVVKKHKMVRVRQCKVFSVEHTFTPVLR